MLLECGLLAATSRDEPNIIVLTVFVAFTLRTNIPVHNA